MLKIATLFLNITLLQSVPTAGQSERSPGPVDTAIDLAECKQETKTSYSKFGSEKVVVKGRRGSRCVIERMTETEGSYVTRECSIPVSRGKLKLAERAKSAVVSKETGQCDTAYLGDVSKHCKIVKTGNLLLER